jgi:hypothetical protein
LFHGIQTTLFAQQMAARAQLEQMRRALPGGLSQVEQAHRASGPYLESAFRSPVMRLSGKAPSPLGSWLQ